MNEVDHFGPIVDIHCEVHLLVAENVRHQFGSVEGREFSIETKGCGSVGTMGKRSEMNRIEASRNLSDKACSRQLTFLGTTVCGLVSYLI